MATFQAKWHFVNLFQPFLAKNIDGRVTNDRAIRDPKRNAVVHSGTSKYSSQTGKITIFYRKTVSYREYRYQLAYDATDGSLSYDIDKRNSRHTIRCMLSTISAASGQASLLIHSDYFKPASTVATFDASKVNAGTATLGAGNDADDLTVTFKRGS